MLALRPIKFLFPVLLTVSLAACGGGGSGGGTQESPPAQDPPPKEYAIDGMPVKGPLAFASLELYEFDPDSSDYLGNLVAEAETNSEAVFSDLSVVEPLADAYVLHVVSIAETKDLNTNALPVIQKLYTVISRADIEQGAGFHYVTPFTTLAFHLTQQQDVQSADELMVAYSDAITQIQEQIGFGIDSGVDLLEIPPVYTSEAVSNFPDRVAYRAAIEAIGAIVFDIFDTTGESSEDILKAIALDLVDGSLDGTGPDGVLAALSGLGDVADYFNSMIIQSLTVPYTDIDGDPGTRDPYTISLIPELMHSEATLIGAGQAPIDLPDGSFRIVPLGEDTDGDGIPNAVDEDDDGDGYVDAEDSFPLNASEWLDSDSDGEGNNADTDDDNDGTPDKDDAFPLDPSEQFDHDGDGIGNNADDDDDNDNVPDASDAFPLDDSEWEDFDGDGIGNNSDPDNDNDGALNEDDAFPFDPNEQLDTDSDGIGNNADPDDDNDGYADATDAFPLDSSEWEDFDGDGIGNNSDPDDDGDGYNDADDYYPHDPLRYEPLSVAQSSLNFSTVLGTSADIAARVLNVSGHNLDWSLEASASWLVVDKTNGIGDDVVVLNVDVTGLASGDYSGAITFTNDFSGETLDIDVDLSVNLPELSISRSFLSFDNRHAWSEVSESIALSLNTGTNSYSFTVSHDFTPVDGLVVEDDGLVDGSADNFAVEIQPSAFSEGRSTGTLTFSAAVLGEVIAETVDLEVFASEHLLTVPDNGVQLTSFPSTSGQLIKAVSVLDSYGLSDTPWTALSDSNWLDVTNSGTTSDALVLSANPVGLATDTLHSALVTVSSSNGAVENTEVIKVGLWVGGSDPQAQADFSATGFRNIAADPVRPYVYASGATDSEVAVYNIYDQTLVRTISNVGVAFGGAAASLGDMEVASDGSKLYVAVNDPNDPRISVIDLENSDSMLEWSLSETTAFGFALGRNKGNRLLLADYGIIYHADTGVEISGGSFSSGYYGNLQIDVSMFGNRFCGINSGLSPNTVNCHDLSYSSFDDTLALTSLVNISRGSNGRDVALNADGSIMYTASGAPYFFYKTNLDDLTHVELDAEAYPTAVEVGPDDALHGASFTWYGPNDVWVYEADGSQRVAAYASGYADEVIARQLAVSGDGYITIVLTSDPKMVFIASYP